MARTRSEKILTIANQDMQSWWCHQRCVGLWDNFRGSSLSERDSLRVQRWVSARTPGTAQRRRVGERWNAVAAGRGINWERLSCSRPCLDNTINKGSRIRPQTDVLVVSQGTVRKGEQLAEDLFMETRGWLNWIWNKVTWAARNRIAPFRSHQFEGKWMHLTLRLLCEESLRQVRPGEYWHGTQYREIWREGSSSLCFIKGFHAYTVSWYQGVHSDIKLSRRKNVKVQLHLKTSLLHVLIMY